MKQLRLNNESYLLSNIQISCNRLQPTTPKIQNSPFVPVQCWRQDHRRILEAANNIVCIKSRRTLLKRKATYVLGSCHKPWIIHAHVTLKLIMHDLAKANSVFVRKYHRRLPLASLCLGKRKIAHGSLKYRQQIINKYIYNTATGRQPRFAVVQKYRPSELIM